MSWLSGSAAYEDTDLTPQEIYSLKAGTILKALRTEWIPVEERLPEDGTYLCTLDGELCGLDEPFTGMCGIENGKWDQRLCNSLDAAAGAVLGQVRVSCSKQLWY